MLRDRPPLFGTHLLLCFTFRQTFAHFSSNVSVSEMLTPIVNLHKPIVGPTTQQPFLRYRTRTSFNNIKRNRRQNGNQGFQTNTIICSLFERFLNIRQQMGNAITVDEKCGPTNGGGPSRNSSDIFMFILKSWKMLILHFCDLLDLWHFVLG